MTDLRQVLSSNMKYWRETRKLSQAKLAEKINTAPNYISQVESQKQFPSVPMIEKIAIALDIDTLELFSAKHATIANIADLRNTLIKDISKLVESYIEKIE